MVTFYVTKELICPRCKGYKVIQAPIWKVYWEWAEEFKSKNSRLPNKDEDRDWWAGCGYSDWEPEGVGGIPNEECLCPDCDGTGVKIEKVDLADALRELERI